MKKQDKKISISKEVDHPEMEIIDKFLSVNNFQAIDRGKVFNEFHIIAVGG